jgi:hypothetical protein
MAFTIIPDLPDGGAIFDQPLDAQSDQLVLEQDITRKITPLSFLTEGIKQLLDTTEIKGSDVMVISDKNGIGAQNLTVDNLMYYINTHLNRIEEVFFVSSVSGVDSVDFAERGKNEQLTIKTIKFAAQQIAKSIAEDRKYVKNPNYQAPVPNLNPTNDPNFVQDIAFPNASPLANSALVRRQYTIMVRSGDYVEENPIYLPPNTSMIGDNLRRTTIRPVRPYLDLFWVDSANYIWGFTFRSLKDPAAAVAFPICTNVYNKPGILDQYACKNITLPNGTILPYTAPNAFTYGGSREASSTWVQDSYYYAYLMPLTDETFETTAPAIHPSVVPEKRPFIYTSPYVQGCTSYNMSDRMPTTVVGDNTNNPLYPKTWLVDSNDPTSGLTDYPPPNNAGMGMRIDGSLVDGYFRSMVIDSYTQVNQGGRGIYLLNHGYAQFVSTFTVATSQGIVCEAGATCSISTSNSTFGLSGLVAFGKSFSEVLSGKFVIPETSVYPISSASFANGNTIGVYGYSIGSNLFTVNDVQSLPVKYPNDDVSDLSPAGTGFFTVASQPYATLCFTVGDDKPWISGYLNGDPQFPLYSGPGYLMEKDINPTITRQQGFFNPLSPLSAQPMNQVKLFFIEQGTPIPSLSGGSTLNDGNYDIYDYYQLSKPTNAITSPYRPNIGLPWDIELSFNLNLDLRNHSLSGIALPDRAYDEQGNPIHFNIDYNGRPVPINYTYFNNGSFTPVTSGTPGAQAQFTANVLNNGKKASDPNTENPGATIDFTNAPVKFYARSVIETGGHTFEFMGTGTRMKYAIPAFGGLTNNVNETASDGFNDPFGNAPGTVFFTSSNEKGNFKVGRDFTIVQSTGTIQGDTFSRAILTLVTPLNIVLE